MTNCISPAFLLRKVRRAAGRGIGNLRCFGSSMRGSGGADKGRHAWSLPLRSAGRCVNHLIKKSKKLQRCILAVMAPASAGCVLHQSIWLYDSEQRLKRRSLICIEHNRGQSMSGKAAILGTDSTNLDGNILPYGWKNELPNWQVLSSIGKKLPEFRRAGTRSFVGAVAPRLVTRGARS